jgi:hypothetical protein
MEELNTTTLEAVMEAVIQKDIPMDYGPWKSFSKEVRCSRTCCGWFAHLPDFVMIPGVRWQCSSLWSSRIS